jgi:hypothetical protein
MKDATVSAREHAIGNVLSVVIGHAEHIREIAADAGCDVARPLDALLKAVDSMVSLLRDTADEDVTASPP